MRGPAPSVWWIVVVAVGCATEAGGGGIGGAAAAGGSAGAAGSGGACTVDAGCVCGGCVETCLCATGDPQACAIACPDSGGAGGTSGSGGGAAVGGTAGAGTGGAGGTAGTGAAGTGGSSGGPSGQPGEFTLSFNGRAYRLYVPSGYTAATPIPLVVGFHGAGDSGGNFYLTPGTQAWKSAADPANFVLVIPDTKSPYGDFAIWQGGNPNQSIPDMLVEMDDVLALIDDVAVSYAINPKQRHALGFSDGGLFLAVAGFARADRFASLLIAGYGWGGSYAQTPSRLIPVQFVCGDADSFFSNAQAAEAFVSSQGHETTAHWVPGVGHMWSGLMAQVPPPGLWSFMQSHPLP